MPTPSRTRFAGRRPIPIPCRMTRRDSSVEPRPTTSLASTPRLRARARWRFSAFKAGLVDLAVAKLGPINSEMKRLIADPVYIDSVLADGAARAQVIAADTMKAVKDIVGFVRR